jgi:hypothetical protein
MDENKASKTTPVNKKMRTARRCLIVIAAILLFGVLLSACTIKPPENEIPGPGQTEDPTPDVPKVFSPKNVIMISVQDLGDGVIDTTYDGKALTPGLNSLRGEFSHYKNNITSSAYASGLDVIMSSSVYGPQYNQPIAGLEGDQINTLGKILAEKGFYTLAVTSGPAGAYGGEKTYESFGYEDFISVKIDDLAKTSVYDAAIEAIKKNDSEHFFLSVTDLGLYVGKTDIEANEIGGSVDVAYYAKRMAYVDSAIAGFIEDLKAEGLYDDTIIVITGTGAAFELTDTDAMAGLEALMGGYTLENYIKAPLLVKLPGHKTGESDLLVSHNDVFVTVADCLGIDDDNLWLNGNPLEKGHDKIYIQSVLNRGSFIDATSIVNAHESGMGVRSKLYDRATKSTTPATDKQDEIDECIAYFEDYYQKLTYGLSTLCYENGTTAAMKTFEENKGSLTVTPEENVADVFPADEDEDFYKNEIDLCNESILFSANEFKGEYISVMFKNDGLMLMPGCKEGTFISDEIYLGGSFKQMLASWNSCSTGGTVEVSVSVRLDDGTYTGWYSWGVWSAIRGLSGSASTEDENGEVGIDILTLNKECQGYVKYRIDIKQTKDESPIVYNVILASDKATSNLKAPENTYWKLDVPYRRQADVPEIGGQICSATSLSMILLYLGEEGLDVGDVAWGVRDYGAKKFGNWAYNVAYAGELGYIAYIDYFDIDAIKWAVYTGHPVACSIKVKQGQMADSGFPNYKTNGHLLCVVGYEERNGQKWLLINDPADPSVKAILESDFEKIYRGVSYIVQIRPDNTIVE